MGKWFVQPQEALEPLAVQQHKPDSPSSSAGIGKESGGRTRASSASSGCGMKGSHLSFSISFFVHGESTVCASIDVRQHPTVRKLTWRHLAAAHASAGAVHVMLAPYGLAGTLTGQSFRAAGDPAIRKLMDEWQQYFPVECSGGAAAGSAAGGAPAAASNQQHHRGPGPGGGGGATTAGGVGSADAEFDMVEVIVGNVRMKYPACYVLLCDADDSANGAAFSHLAASEGGWSQSVAARVCPPLSRSQPESVLA